MNPLPPTVSPDQLRRLAARPGLLISPAGWAALRQAVRADPDAAALFRLLLAQAETTLTYPPIAFRPPHPGGNVLRPMRAAERRIRLFAMLFRLTDDPRYAAAALDVMRPLADAPWPRRHFMDVAIAAHALALGYDWLHDHLTPADRARFADKIRNDALLPSTVDEDRSGWIDADHNWNQVCHGGIVTAALATADKDLDLTRHIVDRALANLPRVAAHYAPDGVYPEGPGYWAYGTMFHVVLAEAFRVAFGSDLGLTRFPGFLPSAAVLDRLTAPSGQYFNFYDNHAHRDHAPVIFFFAHATRDPDMAARELPRALHTPLAPPDPHTGLHTGNDLPLSLLWLRPWDPPLTTHSPAQPLARSTPPARTASAWKGDGFNPVAVLTSDPPADAWLAVKAGCCHKSHAHMDVGSFVFEAAGVRWAIDPEYEDYSALRARAGITHAQLFNYSPTSLRWQILRLGPGGHNVARPDTPLGNALQLPTAHATMGPLEPTPDGHAVTLDLAPLHPLDATRFTRRLHLSRSGTLHITDTLTPTARPAHLVWQWLTTADVEPSHTPGVVLRRAGHALHLRFTPPITPHIQDLSQGPDPRLDAPYPNLTRISLTLPLLPHATASLTTSATLLP